MQRQALAMRRKLLGDKHADVANSVGNLAAIRAAKGYPAEAETILHEALAMRRKIFGDESAEVARSLGNLAAALAQQGKLPEAEKNLRDAVGMQRKRFDNDHPEVALPLRNLAATLARQGKAAEAEPIFREVLAIQEKVLPDDHPDISQTLADLAAVLMDQDKVGEAETAIHAAAERGGAKVRQRFTEAIQILTAKEGSDLPPGVIVLANGTAIRDSEVRKAMRDSEEDLRRRYLTNNPAEFERERKELRRKTIEDLIDRALILSAFAQLGGQLDPKAVQEDFDELVKTKYYGDTNILLKTLAAEGLTLQELHQRREQEIIVAVMQHRYTHNVPEPTEQQIEQYYREHQTEFRNEESAEVSLIVIPKEPTNKETTVESRRKLAEEIRARVAAGADFASEARLHNPRRYFPNSGYCGWMPRSKLRKELADAAFALQTNQISKVVETEDRFILMRVTGYRPAGFKPLAEVRDGLRRKLRIEQRKSVEQDWLNGLRTNAVILRAPEPAVP